jgi:hypothetical protein
MFDDLFPISILARIKAGQKCSRLKACSRALRLVIFPVSLAARMEWCVRNFCSQRT